MRPGTINISRLDDAARHRVCAWLRANGINPMTVPREGRIVVTGTRIHYDEIVFDQRRRGGKRARLKSRTGYPELVTRRRVKRLSVDLNDIEATTRKA